MFIDLKFNENGFTDFEPQRLLINARIVKFNIKLFLLKYTLWQNS